VFFDYQKNRLAVSDQWWIYPIVVVPLTAVVFGYWYYWTKTRTNNAQFSQKDLEQGIPMVDRPSFTMTDGVTDSDRQLALQLSRTLSG